MLEVRGDTSTPEGARQQLLTIDPAGRAVPAVLWTPEGDGPFPLVLIGHGGDGHKLDDSRLDLARRYTSRGVAAAAIDGPWHGERVPPGVTPVADWSEAAAASMVLDWTATIDALSALPEVDAGRIGYGGVSMGTIFGIPFIAAEPRIRAAALGLFGLRDAAGEPLEDAAFYRDLAPRVRCPVLYLVQWHDNLFHRTGALEVYDLLGSEDRRLLANPGAHHETPEHARAASTAFLIEQLRAIE